MKIYNKSLNIPINEIQEIQGKVLKHDLIILRFNWNLTKIKVCVNTNHLIL